MIIMKNIQVRVEDAMKKKADDLFKSLGTSTNEAIKIFLQASINNDGLPFEVKKPETENLLENVQRQMLPITDQQLKNAYLYIESSCQQWTDFDHGVYTQQLVLNGYPYEEDDDTSEKLASALFFTIDGKSESVDNDIVDAADSYSADVTLVADGMINEAQVPEDSKVAIMDEYFIFTKQASSETRINIFRNYILPYLKDCGFDYVGFMNAGMWRADNKDAQDALEKAMKKLNMKRVIVGENTDWSSRVNVIRI